MAITAANIVENHRGCTCTFVGDGVSTALTITVNRPFKRPNRTVTAFVVTAPTKFSTRSERGGLLAPEDGTTVTVASATDNDDGTLTVNTSAAVTNATTAYVACVYGQYTN